MLLNTQQCREGFTNPKCEDADSITAHGDATVVPQVISYILAPPERGRNDAVEADQGYPLEPDRFAVVDDERTGERGETERRDEKRREDGGEMRGANEETQQG